MIPVFRFQFEKDHYKEKIIQISKIEQFIVD